jgi:cyclohexa-1,5-dienecarbonyl-CoA hydratase
MAVRTSIDDGIGHLVLSHPPLNILTRDVLQAIRGELDRLAKEPSLRVLLLSADGKHFSAGASVEEHLPPQHKELIPEFMNTVAELDAFPLPVVAAAQGRCLGGGFELVLAADIIIAAEGATFGQPEILLGVVPPAACAMLPYLTSRSVAAELVYTGEPLNAHDAREAGLVAHVVAADELEREALAFARRIAARSAAALRLAKRTMRGHERTERANEFARACYLYTGALMQTQDALEGLNAFMEKRQPVWSHR